MLMQLGRNPALSRFVPRVCWVPPVSPPWRCSRRAMKWRREIQSVIPVSLSRLVTLITRFILLSGRGPRIGDVNPRGLILILFCP